MKCSGSTQGLRGTAVSPILPHLELILKSEGHGRAAHFRATAKTWVFSGITSMKFNIHGRDESSSNCTSTYLTPERIFRAITTNTRSP